MNTENIPDFKHVIFFSVHTALRSIHFVTDSKHCETDRQNWAPPSLAGCWQIKYFNATSTFIPSMFTDQLQMYFCAFNSAARPGGLGPGLGSAAGFYHGEGQNKKS